MTEEEFERQRLNDVYEGRLVLEANDFFQPHRDHQTLYRCLARFLWGDERRHSAVRVQIKQAQQSQPLRAVVEETVTDLDAYWNDTMAGEDGASLEVLCAATAWNMEILMLDDQGTSRFVRPLTQVQRSVSFSSTASSSFAPHSTVVCSSSASSSSSAASSSGDSRPKRMCLVYNREHYLLHLSYPTSEELELIGVGTADARGLIHAPPDVVVW